MPRFSDALASENVLLMDGAMGTELQRAGVGPNDCYELCNLIHPEWVLGIHQSYADAGARCLLTNTFQANPIALARHGVEDRLEEINAAAVNLARSVAGTERFVLASIGPFEHSDIPSIARLVDSLDGVDALLLETWSDTHSLGRLLQAHEHLWNPGELTVLVSFAYQRGREAGSPPRLRDGHTPEEAARLAESFGAAAVGVNCGRDMGMEQVADVVRRYSTATKLPLLARPNAGTPRREASGWRYPHIPEAMASGLPALVQAGATLIGGCCGTTPAHIAAFRRGLSSIRRQG